MRARPQFDHLQTAILNLLIAGSLALSGCNDDSSQTLLSQAKASLQAGDRKAAAIQLKSAIQKDEHNGEARFELAKIQMALGDYASAEKELRRAREAGLSADKINPLLARALISLGEFQRVLDEIPVPAEGSPTERIFLVARANAQMGLKHTAEAHKSLERALLIAPNDAEAHLAWARMGLIEGNVGQALQQIQMTLQFAPDNLEAWLFKGDLLRASGKSQEAGTAYQAALKIDPHHAGARLALAGIAISENRLAEAKHQVESVLKITPNSLLGLYTQALIDFREKKFTAARDHLAPVLKAAPEYLPALLLNGATEYALGNLQTAEAHLNKVVKAAPGNIYAVRLLAASQLRLGRADEASRTLAPALKVAPLDPGVHVIAGEIALTKKAFAEATEHFEVASKTSPDSAAIRTELGLSRLAQDDSRAMADLQTAAGMKGGGSRPDTLIILTQLKNKQFDAALTSIARLEKKEPTSPQVWNYRGAAYVGKSDREHARSSFNQALKLDPGFFPAAANLARLDLQDQQPAQARQRFENILRIQPEHLNAMLALAELALRNKDEKTYTSWLEKATAAHPKAIEPRILMARYLMAKGEKAKATSVAREAVNTEPKNPAALDLLGTTQFANKDYDNAQGTYRTLVELYPDQLGPRLKLAQIQIAMHQLDAARKTLQAALKLQPSQIETQLLLASLEIRAARYDDAQKIARQIQQQTPASPTGWMLEGDTALSRKQYTAAALLFEQAHKRAPSSTTLIRLDQALTGAGRGNESEKRINGWLANHPQDFGTRLYLAERLTMQAQFNAATTHYLLLNKQQPDNLLVLNNLAWTLSELKDKRALSFAEQAFKLSPESPAVMDTLGWLLIQEGQSARGVALLKQALSKTPDAPEIQYHLAAGFNKMGDRTRAQSDLERLLASGVGFPQEQEARTLLSQLQGRR